MASPRPQSPNDPVSLTREGARRLARSANAADRAPRNPTPSQGQNRAWNPGTKLAKVGGTKINAGSTASPTSGTGTIYDFDPEAGTTTARDHTDTFWNNMGEVAANADIKVTWIDGAWWVINEYCP